MEQVFPVHEAHKRGRAGAALGHVEDLQAATLVAGGLHAGRGPGQQLVQHARGHAQGVLLVHILDQLKQAVNALAGFGADEDDGGIAHKAEIVHQLFAHRVHGLVVLFHGVPLVHGNDAGLALLMGVTGHLGVLLGEAHGGVDHDHAHTAALHGGQAAQNAVALHALFHLAALAQAGGVGKHKAAVLVVHLAVNGIPGGAGLIGHDHPVFAQNKVHQAGFAHVGAADDGHGNAVVLRFVLIGKVQVLAHGIQQVAGAVAVHAGNRDQLAQAQGVKVIQLHGGVAHLVAFVYRNDHRLAAAAQHGRHFLILRRHAGAHVHHHHDAVRCINGQLRLLTDVAYNAVVALRLDAAGINQQHFVVQPLAVAEDPVPGNTGGILHNGKALAHQLVEQGGFAHVGAAHHRHDRFAHWRSPPFLFTAAPKGRPSFERSLFQYDTSKSARAPALPPLFHGRPRLLGPALSLPEWPAGCRPLPPAGSSPARPGPRPAAPPSHRPESGPARPAASPRAPPAHRW